MKKDIRESYSVPSGYFENLEQRLCRIAAPLAEDNVYDMDAAIASSEPVGLWAKVRPYMSLAAVFACALVVGSVVISRTAGMNSLSLESEYEQLFYADLLPITYGPQDYAALFMEEPQEPTLTEEELFEYLIQAGVTVDQLEDYSE